jgi:hypothetical protein
MHTSSALQPLDDLDRPVAAHQFKAPRARTSSTKTSSTKTPLTKSGALGAVAAASSRRRAPSLKIEPAKPASGKAGSGALSPLAWTFSAFAAWGLLVGGRTQVVMLAPATAPVYAALGLPVNLRQMDFENVVSRLTEEDGRQILVVEGEIRNLGQTPRAAPRMRLAVLDAQGNEIYTWTAAAQKSRLLAGEKASFRARLAAPPQDGRDVRVKFASGPDQSHPDKPGLDKAGLGS